jgi:hypothetical protein
MSLRKMLEEVNAGVESPGRHATAMIVDDTGEDVPVAQLECDDDEDDGGRIDLEEGDLDDYLKAVARAHTSGDKRQPIYITDNDSVLVDEAIAALAQHRVVYQQAGKLVVINYDPEDKSYRLTALNVPGVRRELSRSAVFYKKGKKGKKGHEHSNAVARDGPFSRHVPGRSPAPWHLAGAHPTRRRIRLRRTGPVRPNYRAGLLPDENVLRDLLAGADPGGGQDRGR